MGVLIPLWAHSACPEEISDSSRAERVDTVEKQRRAVHALAWRQGERTKMAGGISFKMITGTQIALHMLGDYVLQSDWMADNKTKRFWPAFLHALVYSAPFLILNPSIAGFAFIMGTHFLIDRYRLARFVCRWKNQHLAPLSQNDSQFNTPTGYADSKPDWLKVWLLIACDNTLHLFCNGIGMMI